MMQTESVDPCRCPLCGAPNGCAMASAGTAQGTAQGTEPCWCTLEKFSARLLALVPETARRKACICQACVQADRSAS